MDKSLLEKSFAIKREKSRIQSNLLSAILCSALALFCKHQTFKTYALFWAKNNPKLQTLISNLSFKIATLFALYNSFLYILNRCWRTKIKVTETEAALLGLDRHDSSIELRDENDAPKNESINLQANELNASASKFKSFQESWDEDFLKEKSSLPPTLSKMSITQKAPQKQEDLSELVENNFSFAFPFKRKKSSLIPSFVQNSSPSQLYHKVKDFKPPNLKDYIPGYINRAIEPLKGSIFDDLERVDSMGLSESQKLRFVLNARKWIAKTIFEPINNEINELNAHFKQTGNFEYLIGEASYVSLSKFVSNGKPVKLCKNLQNMLLFLEVSSDQSYLINRISELANDKSLIKFNHTGGSLSRNHKWHLGLPTDGKILIHLLLTYIDIHSPPQFKKTEHPFSAEHFFKNITAQNLKTRTDEQKVLICEDGQDKNFYSLIFDKKYLKVPETNDNIFFVFVYLLVYIKYKHDGYLGNLDFDSGGLNMMTIIDE